MNPRAFIKSTSAAGLASVSLEPVGREAQAGLEAPAGGFPTPAKPVGTVWMAWGWRNTEHLELLELTGTRSEIIGAAAEAVLDRLAATAVAVQ